MRKIVFGAAFTLLSTTAHATYVPHPVTTPVQVVIAAGKSATSAVAIGAGVGVGILIFIAAKHRTRCNLSRDIHVDTRHNISPEPQKPWVDHCSNIVKARG